MKGQLCVTQADCNKLTPLTSHSPLWWTPKTQEMFLSGNSGYVYIHTNFPPLFGIWKYSEFNTDDVNNIFHLEYS